MEPYNVKIITYPDLTKQYRIYQNTIGSDDLSIPVRPHKRGDCNPFDGKVCKDILVDIKDYKDHVSDVSLKRTKKKFMIMLNQMNGNGLLLLLSVLIK